ncbi:MAG: 1-acyl-sn-glycerol-3-phosphate acyltransferase [Rhodobacteraceae bacterium]|nr:1-acyl-sn-glycerol-3-phosphate acyltransferase [Paracoccaceae bacterium]
MPKQEPPAGDQLPRPKTDAFLRWLGRYVFTVFFRQIEIIGKKHIPETGPIVIVAKHSNSLVDAGFITTYFPRMPRMLGASIIWDNKPLVPLLTAARVIPVFRQQDQRANITRNRHAYAATWDLLDAGGVLALFPEGVSHNDPFIKPMKPGTARIVLEAERHRGPLNITIIPVGLNFEANTKFRSRILMQIGEPLKISDVVQSYTQAERQERTKYVRQLNQRIHDGLIAVSPSFETWEEARLVGRTADIWGQHELAPLTEVDFVEAVALRRDFAQGYHWMRKHHPERTAAFWDTMFEYDQLLTTAGLQDRQIGQNYPAISAFGFALRLIAKLAIRLPLSLVGAVLNLIPLQISAFVGRGNDADKRATWLIFSSVIVFPLIWTLQAILAGAIADRCCGSVWGWVAGVTIFLAGPVLGRFSLTYFDFRRQLTHQLRAWLVLRTRKNLSEKLVRTRKELLAELTELVEFYDANAEPENTLG